MAETKYEGLEINPPIRGCSGALIVEWGCPKIGFGELRIWFNDDDKLCIDTEYMSDEFVKAVLCKLVDHMIRCD